MMRMAIMGVYLSSSILVQHHDDFIEEVSEEKRK